MAEIEVMPPEAETPEETPLPEVNRKPVNMKKVTPRALSEKMKRMREAKEAKARALANGEAPPEPATIPMDELDPAPRMPVGGKDSNKRYKPLDMDFFDYLQTITREEWPHCMLYVYKDPDDPGARSEGYIARYQHAIDQEWVKRNLVPKYGYGNYRFTLNVTDAKINRRSGERGALYFQKPNEDVGFAPDDRRGDRGAGMGMSEDVGGMIRETTGSVTDLLTKSAQTAIDMVKANSREAPAGGIEQLREMLEVVRGLTPAANPESGMVQMLTVMMQHQADSARAAQERSDRNFEMIMKQQSENFNNTLKLMEIQSAKKGDGLDSIKLFDTIASAISKVTELSAQIGGGGRSEGVWGLAQTVTEGLMEKGPDILNGVARMMAASKGVALPEPPAPSQQQVNPMPPQPMLAAETDLTATFIEVIQRADRYSRKPNASVEHFSAVVFEEFPTLAAWLQNAPPGEITGRLASEPTFKPVLDANPKLLDFIQAVIVDVQRPEDEGKEE